MDRTQSGSRSRRSEGRNRRVTVPIVGYVRDARYQNMREPIRPTVYVPFRCSRRQGRSSQGLDRGTIHRPHRRRRSPSAGPAAPPGNSSQCASEFRVSNIRTQEELVRLHTVRERMLAMLLALFCHGCAAARRRRTVRSARLLGCAAAARDRHPAGTGSAGPADRAPRDGRGLFDAGARCRSRSRDGNRLGEVCGERCCTK